MFDLLGLDWGEKYFGVAFGSSTTGLIIPAKQTFLAKNIEIELIDEIKNRKITTVIIGYPTTFHFQKTKITNLIEDYKNSLQAQFPDLIIHFIDERGTSKDSDNLVKNTELSHNLAASLILQRWLEKNQTL